MKLIGTQYDYFFVFQFYIDMQLLCNHITNNLLSGKWSSKTKKQTKTYYGCIMQVRSRFLG